MLASTTQLVHCSANKVLEFGLTARLYATLTVFCATNDQGSVNEHGFGEMEGGVGAFLVLEADETYSGRDIQFGLTTMETKWEGGGGIKSGHWSGSKYVH